MNIHITIYTSNPIKRFDKVFFSLSVYQEKQFT